ncbi:MAG: hypothetical protein AB7E47_09885 [Desulfovibrionaceae bacterium]
MAWLPVDGARHVTRQDWVVMVAFVLAPCLKEAAFFVKADYVYWAMADYAQRIVQLGAIYWLARTGVSFKRMVAEYDGWRFWRSFVVHTPLVIVGYFLVFFVFEIYYRDAHWGSIMPYPNAFAKYADLYFVLPLLSVMDGLVWFCYIPARLAVITGRMWCGVVIWTLLLTGSQWGIGTITIAYNIMFIPVYIAMVFSARNAIPAMICVFVTSYLTMTQYNYYVTRWIVGCIFDWLQ